MNGTIKIPGTTVEAIVTKSRRVKGWWSFSLYDTADESRTVRMIASDSFHLDGRGINPTHEQVAQVALILTAGELT